MNYRATLHTRYNIFVSLVMKTGSGLGSVIQRGLTFILRRNGLSIEAMEMPGDVFACTGALSFARAPGILSIRPAAAVTQP